MVGVFAPVKTPAPIINQLNQEIVRYLRTSDAKSARRLFEAQRTASRITWLCGFPIRSATRRISAIVASSRENVARAITR